MDGAALPHSGVAASALAMGQAAQARKFSVPAGCRVVESVIVRASLCAVACDGSAQRREAETTKARPVGVYLVEVENINRPAVCWTTPCPP